MNIEQLKDTYKCTSCDAVFKGFNTRLAPVLPSDKQMINSRGMFYKYVDLAGIIWKNRNAPCVNNYWLVCPYCDTIHLYGFPEAYKK